MKKFKLLLVVLIFIVGCHKWSTTTGITENPTDINQLNISADFDWRTSLNVAFYITNAPVGMVQITSPDGQVVFHKGYYSGVSPRYHIIVSIPMYLDSVLINGASVELSANIIEFALPTTPSAFKDLKANNSLTFDGQNDYVSIDNPSNNRIVDDYPFTFSAWFKTSGFEDDDEDMVIFSMADSRSTSRYYGIYIGEDEDGAAMIRARNGSERSRGGNVDMTDGEWHQIVGVFADKKDRKLYVDGELVASDTRKVDFKTQSVFNIGRWADRSPKSYFNGQIDEVQVWSKALSATEVSNYFENKPDGTESDLEAYWKLEEGSGTSITDQTSNNRTGTINGAIWNDDGQGASSGVNSEDVDGDGISNAEDDFPDDADRSFNNFFPASGYGTLAFEDLWPARGDYDFNDLVVDYQFRTVTNKDNFVTEIYADFVVRAIGASFQNGLGFQLPNNSINSSNITVTGYSVLANYVTLQSNGLESGQSLPTIIVFDNAFDILPRISGELGVNTDPNASVTEPDTVKVVMTFTPNTYTSNDIGLENFNPFIMIDQDRGMEVHLADYPPTQLANIGVFGQIHDNSSITTGRYYRTADHLPWAINIYESFAYPIEKTNIIFAHLRFSAWAESGGEQFPDWYQNKDEYRDDSVIYD